METDMKKYVKVYECCVCGNPHSGVFASCSQACYDIEQQVLAVNSENPPKTIEEFRKLIEDGKY